MQEEMLSKLEWLPNEIFFHLFEYLPYVQLLNTFNGLNYRLNTLLNQHFEVYHLDFRSISKPKFHLICSNHLRTIINRVKSFYLSNDDHTPTLLDLFHSYQFSLTNFIHLQNLSIDSIGCLFKLNQLICQCRELRYLTKLSILRCSFHEETNVYSLIINLWNLSKLKSCQIVHRSSYELKLINEMRISSSSIEYLSLENFQINLNDLSKLFHHTPLLRHFHGHILQHYDNQQLHQGDYSSINSLTISLEKRFDSFSNFFQNFSHLTRLIIQTDRLYFNGYQWEKVLQTYLTHLHLFQLKMTWKYSHPQHIEEQLNELINSFTSSFWLEEHQWFVQCHWFILGISHLAILYTLPYSFEQFFLSSNEQWSKSTCSNSHQSYPHVQYLTVMNLTKHLRIIPSFENLIHLKIHLPLMSTFGLLFQSFDQLKSLQISFVQGSFDDLIQSLLDRSPRLYSLCLKNFSDLQILSNLTNSSIYRLDFLTKNTYKRCFNTKECSRLIHSSLGRQCRVLLIYLNDRLNVIQLVKNMIHLQSLIIQCKNDQCNEEFVQWLREHLPSTCSIERDQYHIRCWIN